MSARILGILDTVLGRFIPPVRRCVTDEFGPTPAARQHGRLIAAEHASRRDVQNVRLHVLLNRAWRVFSTNSLDSFERVEILLAEIERITAHATTPTGGSR